MIVLAAGIAAFLIVTLLVLDNARLRKQLRRELRERAEMAARALSANGTVVVDGHILPDPQDDRWREQKLSTSSALTTAKDQTETMLTLGPVCVSNITHCVYVRSLGDAPALRETVAMITYATTVWRAHNNRVVRKAMEAQ